MESMLISSIMTYECYTPQEEDMSQICSILEAWEKELSMALWKEHFESLPPKIKLAVPSNYNS